MFSSAPIKAILFDFGGTLDADGVAWKERFRAYYDAESLDLDDEKFDRRFYDADDPLVGAIPPTLGIDETAARLAANFEAGLDRPDLARGARVAASFARDSRNTIARNAAALSVLGERFKLGIVSNFYGNLDAVCTDAGIRRHLSVVIDSQVVGVEKPDARIFMLAVDELGLSAAECLFVGDSLRRDRIGARNAGIPFVWIAPQGGSGSEHAVDHPVVAKVPDILGCFQ